MNKIGLYGISANPPTLGHYFVAQMIVERSKLVDELWVLPSYVHFFGKTMVSFNHRFKMSTLTFNTIEKVRVVDYEKQIMKNNPSFNGSTYEFMQYIKIMYPDNEYSIVIGKDNADTMNTWNHGIELINNERFIVIPRNEACPSPDVWYMKSPHLYISGKPYNASSTEARNKIKNNDSDLHYLLADSVYSYIIDNKLYDKE